MPSINHNIQSENIKINQIPLDDRNSSTAYINIERFINSDRYEAINGRIISLIADAVADSEYNSVKDLPSSIDIVNFGSSGKQPIQRRLTNS